MKKKTFDIASLGGINNRATLEADALIYASFQRLAAFRFGTALRLMGEGLSQDMAQVN